MKSFRIVVFLAIGFGIASCNPKYYSANSQNVPLISEEREINLLLSGNGNQVGFQGSYGIAENIAVKASGGFFLPADMNNGDGGSGKFIELGAGYFTPVSKDWVFETYGILGLGSVENHFPSTKDTYPGTDGDISANILRVGIQPNFGYKSKYFSAAVSSRIINLSYSKIKGDLVFNGEDQINYLENNSSNFLVEPALTIRGGLEKVKLQVQYGYSLNLSNSNFRQDNSFLTIGLNYNFK